jgi:redox-sensitive bicupin YhaK (pirin superfamily)
MTSPFAVPALALAILAEAGQKLDRGRRKRADGPFVMNTRAEIAQNGTFV